VPELSRFFGIVVRMRYNDHLPAHIHVEYGEHHASIEIESGLIDGELPPRVLGMALEWTRLRRQDLMNDWELARRHLPLKPVDPLE
jgi:hypothetical protein